MDHQYVIDALADDPQGQVCRLALRSRSGTYDANRLAQYKRQFTIRRSRPSGEEVEWDKLFHRPDLPLKPDLFCYGWRNDRTGTLDDYLVLRVPALQALERNRHLSRLGRSFRNVDDLTSELFAIPLAALLRLDGGSDLVAYHSPNHPGIPGGGNRPGGDDSPGAPVRRPPGPNRPLPASGGQQDARVVVDQLVRRNPDNPVILPPTEPPPRSPGRGMNPAMPTKVKPAPPASAKSNARNWSPGGSKRSRRITVGKIARRRR